jgi:iron complex transport system substrate-binding protein
MERVVLDPPELIVTGFFEATTEYVNHWSASRHPAFREAFAATPAVHLAADLISCPAWFSVEAAEQIARHVDGSQKDRLDAE